MAHVDVGIETVRSAVEGNRAALDAVIVAIQDDIYGLAVRMLGLPGDAEDATQEILVKVVTNLSTFRGESALRTWVWTIAVRHLMGFRRRAREAFVSFELVQEMIHDGDGREIPASTSPEEALLEKEVGIGCTGAMLLSPNRDQRVAFALVEVFDFSCDEAAEIAEVPSATLRKRLQRARQRLGDFLGANCGLADAQLACRCARQIETNVRVGTVVPGELVFATHAEPRAEALARVRETDAIERAVEVFRRHPRYRAPDRLHDGIRRLVNSGSFQIFR